MEHVTHELCYIVTILHRNYRKMTISWSFSNNSFVKFHDKIILEPQHNYYFQISVITWYVLRDCAEF